MDYNLFHEIEAYASYLNARRDHLDKVERELFEQDQAKAKRAMEVAWLEQGYGDDLPVV